MISIKLNKVVFIVNFEHISHLFLTDFEQINVSWVTSKSGIPEKWDLRPRMRYPGLLGGNRDPGLR